MTGFLLSRPRRVAALLVGTAETADKANLPDVPAVRHTTGDLHGVLSRRCGLSSEDTSVLEDPEGPEVISDAIARLTAKSLDVLLIYYVGHGIVGDDNHLRLATRRTRLDNRGTTDYTTFGIDSLTTSLTTRPGALVLFLDCCNSSRALSLDHSQIQECAIFCSAGVDEQALAPEGASRTQYSGHLIDLLERGSSELPHLMSFGDLAAELVRICDGPRPRSRFEGGLENRILTDNAHPRPKKPDPQQARRRARPSSECPYPGMRPFAAADDRMFRGRDELIGQLCVELTARHGPGLPMMLVGPSGSGKSSLAMAGVVPDLRLGRTVQETRGRRIVCLTPTNVPLTALVSALTRGDVREVERHKKALLTDPSYISSLAGDPVGEAGPIVIVDQFEEAFGPETSQDETRVFVEALCALSTASDSTGGHFVSVLLVLRSDFVSACSAYPGLLRALEVRQKLVRPMTVNELRQAIEGPAITANLEIEPGFIDVLLADLGMPAAGSTPARLSEAIGLSHIAEALRAAWERREDGTLTVRGYRVSGGVHKAVTSTATRVYEALRPTDQALARKVLVQLVHFSPGVPPTRRRRPMNDIVNDSGPVEDVERVLEALQTGRLLSIEADPTGTQVVELVHDALITGWPIMRQWLDEEGVWHGLREQIFRDARAWEASGHETKRLYSGKQLETALAHEYLHPGFPLHPLGSRFLGASQTEEQNRYTQARRARRNLRILKVLSAVLALLLAAALTAFAVTKWQAMRTNDESVSRHLAAEAISLHTSAPGLAARLAVAAYHRAPTDEAHAALLTIAMSALPTEESTPISSSLPSSSVTAFSPDGRILALTADDGTVWLWNTHRHRSERSLQGQATALAFSPDGTLLAGIVGRDLVLWQSDSGKVVAQAGTGARGADRISFKSNGRLLAVSSSARPMYPHAIAEIWRVWPDDGVRRVAVLRATTGLFAPAGDVLATAGADGLRLKTVSADGSLRGAAALSPSGRMSAISFSSEGGLLAVAHDNGTVDLWTARDPQHPTRLTPAGDGPMLADGPITSVGFAPDDKRLVVVGTKTELWNITSPAHPMLSTVINQVNRANQSAVTTAVFSPDGALLATGGDSLQLWNVGGFSQPGAPDFGLGPAVPAMGKTTAVALSSDGGHLAIGQHDGRVRLISTATAEETLLKGTAEAVSYVTFSTDGATLVVGHSKAAQVWDLHRSTTRPIFQTSASVTAYAPSANRLAMVSSTRLTLLDLHDPAHPSRIASATSPDVSDITDLAVSSDGCTVASSSDVWKADGSQLVHSSSWAWDAAPGNDTADVPTALSPDGRLAVNAQGTSLVVRNTRSPAEGTWHMVTSGSTASLKLMAFTPDSGILVTADSAGTVVLWARDGTSLGPVTAGNPGGRTLAALAVGPHGLLATATADGSALITRTDPPSLMAELCAIPAPATLKADWPTYSHGIALSGVCT
ncbi:caspase family protein [Streptomyces sp. NPDC059837]|uniref:nSTAND1 domain-containing NTPase n=1 Tax=Streptomyces sp. NPDC059837 TaxID=3346968 RepID=UPI0036499FD7